METTRNLVSIVVKFPACVQDGHDYFGRRYTLIMDLGGNTAPIVTDGNGLIGVNNNLYLVAVACQSLINRVIDDFEYHMVKA